MPDLFTTSAGAGDDGVAVAFVVCPMHLSCHLVPVEFVVHDMFAAFTFMPAFVPDGS